MVVGKGRAGQTPFPVGNRIVQTVDLRTRSLDSKIDLYSFTPTTSLLLVTPEQDDRNPKIGR